MSTAPFPPWKRGIASPKMGSVVLRTLSVLLGLFFLFVGAMKLTPKISKDMHKDIRKGFIQYSKVFPLSQTLGFKISSKWYRKIVGWAEVCCGFALVFIPGLLKQLANVLLLFMMLVAVYTHYAIGDKFERMAPAIVFTFMLTCRFIIYLQDRHQKKKATKLQSNAVTNPRMATIPEKDEKQD